MCSLSYEHNKLERRQIIIFKRKKIDNKSVESD